ncbi:NAD-dependent epimerase/dehydratase family protein [Bacteroidota bacterium]
MEKTARILITGASGFIGQHLLEELKQSQYQIKILTIEKQPSFWTSNKQFEIYQGDIANKEEIEVAVRNSDIIIHFAAEIKNSERFERTNVTGVRNLAQLAIKYQVKKFIHLSSVGIYGLQYSLKEIIIDEGHQPDPQKGYEKSKWESEKILLDNFNGTNTILYIIRPTNVFGEYHPREQLLRFLQYLQIKKRIIYHSRAKVNYLYVKDLVQIVHHLIDHDYKDRIFNIGDAITFEQFVLFCEKFLGVKIKKYKLPIAFFILMTLLVLQKNKAYLKSLFNRIAYSSGLLKRNNPFMYHIDQGIKNTIAYYKEEKKL